MEPIDSTSEALNRLARRGYPELGEQLLEHTAVLVELIPTIVGVSVCKVVDEVPVTLVASTAQAQQLDAMQYLDGGPCVASVERATPVVLDAIEQGDPLSEQSWSWFARGSAALGVQASLSLPLLDASGTPVGSVNVYASEPGAFVAHLDDIAGLFGAWAPGAVMDADLSFATRSEAVATSQALVREDADIEGATRIIADLKTLSSTQALQSLLDTAARAGVEPVEIARGILLFHQA